MMDIITIYLKPNLNERYECEDEQYIAFVRAMAYGSNKRILEALTESRLRKY